MLTMLKNRKGQAMVEYGLIISLVAIVAMAGLLLLGPAIDGILTQIANAL